MSSVNTRLYYIECLKNCNLGDPNTPQRPGETLKGQNVCMSVLFFNILTLTPENLKNKKITNCNYKEKQIDDAFVKWSQDWTQTNTKDIEKSLKKLFQLEPDASQFFGKIPPWTGAN